MSKHASVFFSRKKTTDFVFHLKRINSLGKRHLAPPF